MVGEAETQKGWTRRDAVKSRVVLKVLNVLARTTITFGCGKFKDTVLQIRYGCIPGKRWFDVAERLDNSCGWEYLQRVMKLMVHCETHLLSATTQTPCSYWKKHKTNNTQGTVHTHSLIFNRNGESGHQKQKTTRKEAFQNMTTINGHSNIISIDKTKQKKKKANASDKCSSRLRRAEDETWLIVLSSTNFKIKAKLWKLLHSCLKMIF